MNYVYLGQPCNLISQSWMTSEGSMDTTTTIFPLLGKALRQHLWPVPYKELSATEPSYLEFGDPWFWEKNTELE